MINGRTLPKALIHEAFEDGHTSIAVAHLLTVAPISGAIGPAPTHHADRQAVQFSLGLTPPLGLHPQGRG